MLFGIIRIIACSGFSCDIYETEVSNNSECQNVKPKKHPKRLNQTYTFKIKKTKRTNCRFHKTKRELIEDMIQDYEKSDIYKECYFDIEKFEDLTERNEFNNLPLGANDEVLEEIVGILNKANGCSEFTVEIFCYQEDLSPYVTEIMENLKYSKNPAIVKEFIKETNGIFENSLIQTGYAQEFLELCKKPEIKKYIEYFLHFTMNSQLLSKDFVNVTLMLR